MSLRNQVAARPIMFCNLAIYRHAIYISIAEDKTLKITKVKLKPNNDTLGSKFLISTNSNTKHYSWSIATGSGWQKEPE